MNISNLVKIENILNSDNNAGLYTTEIGILISELKTEFNRISNELSRVQIELTEPHIINDKEKYNKLHAVLQTLVWVENHELQSPTKRILILQEDSKDCLDESHPILS